MTASQRRRLLNSGKWRYPLSESVSEVRTKLRIIREELERNKLSALRLRGVDWFSWITAGGSDVVLMSAETGVAEVLITARGAWILTNTIEETRLREEEVPPEFEFHAGHWTEPESTEAFVKEQTRGGLVASDRMLQGEREIPAGILAAKRRLLQPEIDRYRSLCRDAAEAMTSALLRAHPDWTENRLAAEGARELLDRGIHPALVLAGGDERGSRFRHPVPTSARIGDRAMLVFCARRHGLYANLTRFVYFRQPSSEERRRFQAVADVEAAAFRSTRIGARLSEVFEAIVQAYRKTGHDGEHLNHHQGGTTGYLSREVVGSPAATGTALENNTALAWNPSLPGAKIEDTVLLTLNGTEPSLEVLTADPKWPVMTVQGRQRPDLLIVKG